MANVIKCDDSRILDLVNDQDQELNAQIAQYISKYDGQFVYIQRVYRKGYQDQYYLLQTKWDCATGEMVKAYPPIQVKPFERMKTHWQVVE